MVLDQPERRRPAETGGDAGRAELGLDLDDDRAQHADAPAGAAALYSG